MEKYNNVIRYILAEKWLTVTVIGSVFTFQFVSAFKNYILDPLLDFLLPKNKFKFMEVTLRDGIEMSPPNPKIVLGFGNWIIEFIKWGIMMTGLYLLAKYTNFPELKNKNGSLVGNYSGAAIM